MTSLWRHLWPNYDTLNFKILTQCVKLLGERVLQVWWWYLYWFRRYRKKTRGGLEIASPSGARVKKERIDFKNNFGWKVSGPWPRGPSRAYAYGFVVYYFSLWFESLLFRNRMYVFPRISVNLALFLLLAMLKGTNPPLEKSLNIPEIYAKMLGRFHWLRL